MSILRHFRRSASAIGGAKRPFLTAWGLPLLDWPEHPFGIPMGDQAMSQLGQTEKTSSWANVFRFTPESRNRPGPRVIG
jgi:hypothetical protein